ncbi:MAG TPA: hypothetical protein VEB22_08500 [Phycisphaerales bacterium]|nr:hypothetical protein [Phycisphaerales bacterium]
MTLAAALIAASLLVGTVEGAGVVRQPNGPKLEQPVPLPKGALIREVRDAVRQGPIAERLTVEVRHPEKSTERANITLRIAPGAARDFHDAQVAIDAGQLRVHARGGTVEQPGELIAVASSNPTVYYRVPLQGAPTLAALSAALLPLPLPTLTIYFARDDETLSEPTPLTRGISWGDASLLPSDPSAPVTLTGTVLLRPDAAAAMLFEFQQDRRRFRSLTAPVSSGGKDRRVLTVTAAWIDPGDPKTWTIDTAGRTRVETLAALGTKIEPKKPEEPAKPEAPKPDPAKPEPARPEKEPAGPSPANPEPPAPKVGPQP